MEMDNEFSILIVDDDELSLKVLTDILKPYYNVFVANSGAKTIRLSIERRPDLIILDIVMPKINGFETLVKLKNIEETRDIPVIFITGLDSHQDEEKGLFLGAVDYIRKPFVNSIVKARVKTHIQIVKQIRTIEKEIMQDFLLEIPNRRYMDKRMRFVFTQAVIKQTEFSFLLIDIDDFKNINDNYGHPHGDIVLQSVSKTIKNMLREVDMVARYGGEEFGVILPNTNKQEALTVSERIRKAIEDMNVLCVEKNEITKVTVSIGITSVEPCRQDIEIDKIISNADKALYIAKNGGKNKSCFL